MKRLLPLLFLWIVGWMVCSASPVVAQSKAQAPLELIARDDTASTFVNTTVVIDVLANDEETNVALKFVITRILSGPFNGNARILRNDPANGDDDLIEYTPANNYIGKDSLRYEISSSGGQIKEATVRIFVNRPPVAMRDEFVVVPATATQLDVLANDTDPDNDPLIVDAIVTAPMHGTATITAGGKSVTYTSAAGFKGLDSLRYSIFDGKNGQATAWAKLIVDRAPVANNDAATTTPATAISINVLSNDTDPDSDPLTVSSIAQAPANGTVQIIDNGARVRYTPAAGFVGTDTFRYIARDPLGATGTATVTVTVNSVPVANDDQVTTPFETASEFDVLANDTDADNDPLTITAIVAPPSHGTAQIVTGSKKIRYTPDANYFGADTFTYRIADGRGGTDVATVNVTVAGTAAVQLIHNAPGAGTVDIYVNNVRVADNLAFRQATPYLSVGVGSVDVDITMGTAPNNNNPLFSRTVSLLPDEAYIAIASGVVGQNFSLLVEDDARRVANNANAVEFIVVNGVPDAPANGIDVRRLDPNNSNLPSALLADNLLFGEAMPYQSLPPGFYNLDATNFNNTTVYDAYRFDLTGFQGQTVVLLASGLLANNTFALIGFDAAGTIITPAVVTASEGTEDLPETFAIHGNFPNPFNPSTTIQFDLPEAAQVSIEVIDVMGRQVMTVPAQQVAAGANRSLRFDASALASGTYFYRVVARTATDTRVDTGRMTLVK